MKIEIDDIVNNIGGKSEHCYDSEVRETNLKRVITITNIIIINNDILNNIQLHQREPELQKQIRKTNFIKQNLQIK